MKAFHAIFGVAVLCAGAVHAAGAGTVISWASPSTGAFQNPLSWSAEAVPQAMDRALFSVGGVYTVMFTGNATNERVQLRSGEVEFALNGNAYALTLVGSASVQIATLLGENATLKIRNGAFNTRTAMMAAFGGSSATVDIRGVSATWTVTGDLTVGDGGAGTLTIAEGADVSVSGLLSVGRQLGSSGQVTVDGAGSRLTGAGTLTIGPFQQGVQEAGGGASARGLTFGTVTFVNGATIDPATVSIGGNGLFTGQGAVQSLNVVNAGRIAPGLGGVGAMQLAGAYTQTEIGDLVVEIGGATPVTQHDVLQVQGAAQVAGRIVVTLVNGYNPPPTATFTVLTAGSRTGRITEVVGPTLAGGNVFRANYTPTSVFLDIGTAPAGLADINRDGVVNSSDLGLLLGAWGTSNELADITGDGNVNSSDLGQLLGSWTVTK